MSVQEYLNLPYNIVVKKVKDESGTYFAANVLELDGCIGTGETYAEAYNDVLDAMSGWIEAKLENGFTVPRPLDTEDYSGKFVVRLPKSLHKKLSMEAAKEGVSLNQLALYKLSAG